jgi:hypothetical protein
VLGPAHEQIVRDTIRLAGELGVETVVSMSGTPGDGPGASTVDWVFYPWPADAMELLARQWEAIPFWQMARSGDQRRAPHRVRTPSTAPCIQCPDAAADATQWGDHQSNSSLTPILHRRTMAVIRRWPVIQHVHLKDTGCRPIA